MAYTTRLGLRDELRAASERGVGRNCDERGAESAGGWYIITTNNNNTCSGGGGGDGACHALRICSSHAAARTTEIGSRGELTAEVSVAEVSVAEVSVAEVSVAEVSKVCKE